MLLFGYLFCVLLGLSYLWLIRGYLYHWQLLPADIPDDVPFAPPFLSIIVAARNEEKTISSCMNSLIKLEYPIDKYEIIFVDDHSIDKTAEIIKEYQSQFQQLHLISLQNEGENESIKFPKRRALEAGIAFSKGEIILMTDADCEVSPHWAKLISSVFKIENCVFVGGPVLISLEKKTMLTFFQALDMTGMMLITGAGFHSGNQLLANGANMAFSKKAFQDSGGFSNFPARASGDDMFLLHQLNECYPGRIRFLKSLKGLVKTKPMSTLGEFIQQRIRWASKNSHYKELKISISIVLIFLLSTLTILLGVLSFIKFNLFFPLFLILYLSKFSGDYLLQREAILFFKESRLSRYIFISQNIHTLYIFFIGFAGSLLPKYPWKGRIVK